jgi:hypothetical protein
MIPFPRVSWTVLGAALLLAGCDDSSTGPRPDVVPPAAPRGLLSVTGNNQVRLRWLENTEHDVTGYRIYVASCAAGPGCPYDRIGSTSGTEFLVTGLANGETRFYAVSAVDGSGNESELTREEVFDTPRPEGFGRALDNFWSAPNTSGYDFSAALVRAYDSPSTDIFFSHNNNVSTIYAPFQDTDIQDAGWASTLDAIDYAPAIGWSPSGSVEAVTGHCYVVRIGTQGVNHFAKFRVTGVDSNQVIFDWAYQVDPDNRELGAKRSGDRGRVRRVLRLQS